MTLKKLTIDNYYILNPLSCTINKAKFLPAGCEVAGWSSQIEPVSGTDTDLVTEGMMFWSDILQKGNKRSMCSCHLENKIKRDF